MHALVVPLCRAAPRPNPHAAAPTHALAQEGLRLSPHLMFYFLFWVLAGVAVDFCLFYAATDYVWYLAMAMVGGAP